MYAIPARRDSTTPKATISFLFGDSFLNGGTALVNRIGCSMLAKPAANIFSLSCSNLRK